MSFSGVQDKDLPIKLRMMNFFWNQGWYVRPNVHLFRYLEGKRTNDEYTDIDVLAIRLLPLLAPTTAICSAKSGQASDTRELFWLSGVKSYFDASVAYYVRTTASLIKARALCEKLGIVPLNDTQLRVLESRFAQDGRGATLITPTTFRQIGDYLSELKSKKAALYNYVTERYWIEPPSSQVLRLLTAFVDVDELSLAHEPKLFMKYYLTSLFTLTLYRLAHSLVAVPTDRLRSEVETAIMGGEISRSEKEKIFASIKSYLEKIAESHNLSSELIAGGLDLREEIKQYSGNIYDAALPLIEDFKRAAYVPRMVDALTYELAKKPGMVPPMETVTLPDLQKEDWAGVGKLAKNVFVIIQRMNGFSRAEIPV
jgi:hypothetical protein